MPGPMTPEQWAMLNAMGPRPPQTQPIGPWAALTQAVPPIGDDVRMGERGVQPRPDGDISTEISITVTDPRLNGGRPTNIPTLVRGQKNVDHLLAGGRPTQEQENLAIERALDRQKAGGSLPSFGSIGSAVTAAEKRTAAKGDGVPLTAPAPWVPPQMPTFLPPVVPPMAVPTIPGQAAPMPQLTAPSTFDRLRTLWGQR